MRLGQGYHSDEVQAMLKESGFTAQMYVRGEVAETAKRASDIKARRCVVERVHSRVICFRRPLIRSRQEAKEPLGASPVPLQPGYYSCHRLVFCCENRRK